MRYLIAFLKRYAIFFLFLLLEGIALIWIVQHHRYQRSVLSEYTNQLTGSVFMAVNNASDYLALKEINEQLLEENASLRQKIKGAPDIEDTISSKYSKDTLSYTTMDSAYTQYFVYEPAKIIHNTVHKANNYIMINKGENHGIEPDMGIVGKKGVQGIIVNTSKHFSWAMSMLHSNIKISAKLKKNDQMGTVSWGGNSYSSGVLSDIPAHINISMGDTIVTSGFSNIFPEGLLIGTVNDVDVKSGRNLYNISFRFAEDFNSIQYGYVIKNLFRNEQQQLIEETKTNK